MNAITLLKSDHRKAERLFERYREATETTKQKLLAQLTKDLMAHMVAEEKVLYPALRTGIEDGPSLVDEAVREHEEAKGLLADLASGQPGTFDVDAKVATLRRAIDHHVKEEEQEIFPEMEKSFERKRLLEIGAQVEKAKRSAPDRPPATHKQKSPGATLGGVAEAAKNRLTSLFQPPSEPKARRASTSARTSAAPKRAAKAKVAPKRAAKPKRKTASRG